MAAVIPFLIVSRHRSTTTRPKPAIKNYLPSRQTACLAFSLRNRHHKTRNLLLPILCLELTIHIFCREVKNGIFLADRRFDRADLAGKSG